MTTFISYGKFSSKTGRELVKATGLQRVKTWSKARRAMGKAGKHVIINWGATIGDGLTERLMRNAKAAMMNHPDALMGNKDKRLSLEKMHAAEVPVPAFWKIADVPDDAYPVIARTKNHFGGSGFWRCNDKEALVLAESEGATHALKLIVKSAEYRVHVFLNRAVRIVRKVKTREDASDLCRSHKNGWRFKSVAKENIPAGLEEIAVNAVKSIGLQTGAVDVVTQKKTGRLLVLEVNSTPGLEGHSIEAWAQAIKEFAETYKHNIEEG